MINYLSVENLSHNWGETVLFDNLTFGISEGQKVALIAKNGAGKTSLLNILAQVAPPLEGEITYRKSIVVGYLPQEPQLDEEQTVLEAVFSSDNEEVKVIRAYEAALEANDQEALGDLITQMDHLRAWDYELRIKQILSELKITRYEQSIKELSGGQRKRLALANLLINEPDFLILDEPTNHLDLDMVEWLEKYLQKSKATLLMVTHDRYFLDRVCNEIMELADGTLYAYHGNYSYFLEKRAERLAQFKQEVEKARNLMRSEQEWINRTPSARSTKAKYRVDAFQELKEKASQSITEEEVKLQIKASRLGKNILNLAHVSKAFGDLKILEDFSYKFARGEKVGIVGHNGSGKSTFLNIITGNLEADSGTIEVGETIVYGYFKQAGISIDEGKKVLEVITDIAEEIDLGNGRSMSAAQFLRHFLFPNEMHYVEVGRLSGGEKKRLYLLTVLMNNPNFLILDEPTNDLDIFTLNVLEEYLQNFEGCLLIVSHDRYFMDKLAEHIFVFEGQGQVRDFPGNYSQLQTQKAQELKAAKKDQKKSKTKGKAPKERPRKLSYMEQKELEALEPEMENLEKNIAELEQQLNSGTLSAEEITTIAKDLNQLNTHLEEKEMRWLELSEIAEQKG